MEVEAPLSSRQIKCDVCNVWCSGNISYQNHIEGRPHYIALQKARGVEFGGPNGTDNGNGPSPPKKRKSNGAEAVHCDICDIELAQVSYDSHLKGVRHLRKIKDNEVAAEVASPHIVPTGQGYRCVVCQVDMSGKVVVLAHIKGSKHLKKLKNPLPPPTADKAEKPSNEPIECVVCRIFVNSPLVLKQHESSARHKHKAELAAKQAAEEAAKRAALDGARQEGKVGQNYDAWDPQG